MDIPNLPTDSYYKFCALIGTLLVFLIGYYTFHRYNILEYNMLQLESHINIDSNHHLKELESIKLLSTLRMNLKYKNNKIAYSTDEDGLYYSNSDIIKLKKEFNTILFNSRKRQIDFQIRSDKLQIYLKQIKQLFYIFYPAFLIGIILALYGYRRWYQIQKIQDGLLKLQLNNSQPKEDIPRPKIELNELKWLKMLFAKKIR
jgi:hypothetical protein